MNCNRTIIGLCALALCAVAPANAQDADENQDMLTVAQMEAALGLSAPTAQPGGQKVHFRSPTIMLGDAPAGGTPPDAAPVMPPNANNISAAPGRFSVPVKFDISSAAISSTSIEQIGRVAQLLKLHPNVRLTIRGHTDASGSVAFNKVLSEKRANIVKSALVLAGIGSDRLASEGDGSRNLVDKANPAGAANRRVEFVQIP